MQSKDRLEVRVPLETIKVLSSSVCLALFLFFFGCRIAEIKGTYMFAGRVELGNSWGAVL